MPLSSSISGVGKSAVIPFFAGSDFESRCQFVYLLSKAKSDKRTDCAQDSIVTYTRRHEKYKGTGGQIIPHRNSSMESLFTSIPMGTGAGQGY
jgi:hypothetical protein